LKIKLKNIITRKVEYKNYKKYENKEFIFEENKMKLSEEEKVISAYEELLLSCKLFTELRKPVFINFF
jgi:hypothetical protein